MTGNPERERITRDRRSIWPSPIEAAFPVDIGPTNHVLAARARMARREVLRAFARFRYVPPTQVTHDLIRAAMLTVRDSPSRPVPFRAERVVVALTTVPPRLARIAVVLRSLLNQTAPADRVLLALPRWSYRTGMSYPAPPALPPGVEVIGCEDHGPATKLLPALIAEPDAAIVVVDDDVIYPSDFLEHLLTAHRRFPYAAVGLRGCRFRPGATSRDLSHVFGTAVRVPTRVDLLMATWGYLVPPGALDHAVHSFDGWPDAMRWVDDIWISGHLARRGVPRLVVPGRGLPLETRMSRRFALDRGPNRDGGTEVAAIAAFSRWW